MIGILFHAQLRLTILCRGRTVAGHLRSTIRAYCGNGISRLPVHPAPSQALPANVVCSVGIWVCSIVGFVLSVVAMAYVTERLHIEVPPPLGFILLIPVYVACGIAGAWLTLRIVNRAVSTFLNSSW